MPSRFSLPTLLCLAIFILAIQATSYNRHYTRTLGAFYPEDRSLTGQVNILFRSNVPEDKHRKFVYHELLDEMLAKAQHERKVLVSPEDVYMVVVSLVSDRDAMLKGEDNYFRDHPERGEHINMQVHGQNEDPADYTPSQIAKKVESLDWMATDINEVLDYLKSRVTDFSTSKNIFVVFHCQHGHDRTGVIAGSWNLQYAGLDWEQVNGSNYEIIGAMSHPTQRALTWYCHHLQFAQGYDALTCTHMNTNKHNKQKPELLHWDEPSTTHWNLIIPIIVLSSVLLVSLLCVCVLSVLLCVFARKQKQRQSGKQHSKLKNFEDERAVFEL